MSLCEVDSDISWLSIDQGICLRELPQGKISAGADAGVTASGESAQPCNCWHQRY